MSTSANTICLALETAVGSGSVAVIRDGLVVAESDSADMHPARAEQLLTVLRDVLDKGGIRLDEISLVAVSVGPGSYSGIRIGVSTSIGLKNALSIDCRGVSLLEAIAAGAVGTPGSEIVVAVPVGKNDIAWQRFDTSAAVPRELEKPALVSFMDFKAAVQNMDRSTIRFPRDLLERLGYADHGSRAADDATTLAALVGKVAIDRPGDGDLRPIYLRSGTGF